jgi:hypothetical protein
LGWGKILEKGKNSWQRLVVGHTHCLIMYYCYKNKRHDICLEMNFCTEFTSLLCRFFSVVMCKNCAIKAYKNVEVSRTSVCQGWCYQCWRATLLLLWKMKVNVNLFLCLIDHHGMKACRGLEVKLHTCWTSMLDGGEWTVSPLWLFPGGEGGVFRMHRIGSWVHARADLDALEKREIFFSYTRNLTQIAFPPRSEPRQYIHWAVLVSVKTYNLFNYPLLYWGRNIRACNCMPFMNSLFKFVFKTVK